MKENGLCLQMWPWLKVFNSSKNKKKIIEGPTEKMSKSKKNVIEPKEILESFGIDATRIL